MLFVAIVDGKIPIVHAFIDHTGRTVSVDGEGYSCCIEASFPNHSNTKSGNIQWMQYGVPQLKVPHLVSVRKYLVFVSFHPLTVFSEI